MNDSVNPSEVRTAVAELRKSPFDAQRGDEELERDLKRRLRLRPLWNPERAPQD